MCDMSNLKLPAMFSILVFFVLFNLSFGVFGKAESLKDYEGSWWKDSTIRKRIITINRYPWKYLDKYKTRTKSSESASNDWSAFKVKPIQRHTFDLDLDSKSRESQTEFDNIMTNDYSHTETAEWDFEETVVPFDKNRLTEKPFDWNRLTEKPFEWNRFTIKSVDWNSFTYKPYEFNKIPINYKYTIKSSSSSMMEIYMPIVFIVSIITLLKYAVSKYLNSRQASSSAPNPSSMIILATRRSQTSDGETAISSESSLPHDPTTYTASSNCETDKPPDYSTVVNLDFAGVQDNIPCPIPDSPPPKYEECQVNQQ